ncbi:hypothetical protein PRK78_002216 [Emydomyces testavorans]|uniref:Uncharacterized protein n=1 Tax=Emydomyces testavorans TaxID=2070801 RepID=A0AAF0DFA2_9EURO|nr:hypothetical protein PRK78_002216 [Emydomyces testavorans]
METDGADLLLSREPSLNEPLKSREGCKYIPRSAGSVQRPQRSEDLLELVRFFTNYDAPFPEHGLMGLGNGSVSDLWSRKDPQKAKKWKSQEDFSPSKGWQKPGLKWKRDKHKLDVTTSDPDENRPPPISKDPKIPQLLLPATRSKSMIGDVDCECFYPGVGTLPPTADLSDSMPKSLGSVTSMWTPPTLELPLTPSSSEFSPVTENRDQRHIESGSESASQGAQSRSSTESKQEEEKSQPNGDGSEPDAYRPLRNFKASKSSRGQAAQQDQPLLLNNPDAPRRDSDVTSESRETPNNVSELHKRDGVCVSGFPQTQDTDSLLPVSQKQSTYIDIQYLPRRTSSRRGLSQEQTDLCCFSQPLPQDCLLSCFQHSTSCSSEPPPLIHLPAQKRSVQRRPAPLILSSGYQSESFVETLPPTPASPSFTMFPFQAKKPAASQSSPSKSFPLAPTGLVARNNNNNSITDNFTDNITDSQELQSLSSKASLLWPPQLSLHPSRSRITKADILSPRHGNAFAQMSSLPSMNTMTHLDSSVQLPEPERHASEAHPPANDAATMLDTSKTTIVEIKTDGDGMTLKEGDISAKSSPTRQDEAITTTTAHVLPKPRNGPGKPPTIPLPANPPKCDSGSVSPNKARAEKSDSAKMLQQAVPNSPTIDEKSFEQILNPKTPKSAKAKRAEKSDSVKMMQQQTVPNSPTIDEIQSFEQILNPKTPNSAKAKRAEKSDSVKMQQQAVPYSPTIDDIQTFEQILNPKSPNSAKAKRAATDVRDSQSSIYSRPSKGPVTRSSWDTVGIGFTSRPATPSLPSSDNEKGVYAYCGTAPRSGKSRRRHRHDTQVAEAYMTASPVHKKKDRDGQGLEQHQAHHHSASRPSTRGSLEQRRNIDSPSFRLSAASRTELALVQQLQEKIVFLERQNKMLHAALSAALDMGGTYDVGLSRAMSFAQGAGVVGDMLARDSYVSQSGMAAPGMEAGNTIDTDNAEFLY